MLKLAAIARTDNLSSQKNQRQKFKCLFCAEKQQVCLSQFTRKRRSARKFQVWLLSMLLLMKQER